MANREKTGGRKPGTPNKATLEQKATLEELARAHTKDALETLVSICRTSESDAARVSAASALLDRGYGKPRQGFDMKPEGGAVTFTWLPST